MSIEWNRVTRLSQAVAIVLGVLIFVLGFCLGLKYQEAKDLGHTSNSYNEY